MWGFLAIFVAFIVFWVYFKKLQKPDTSASSAGPFSLAAKPQVGTPDASKLLLNSTNTGTFQAYVYPLQAQKTGTMTLCNPAGSANPGEPDCSTGQYNLCKCVGNDCSKCTHSGYVNVLNISNVIRVELLAAPDASRQNAAGVQLVVRTLGMSSPTLTACPIPGSQLPVNPEDEAALGTVKFCCNTPLVNGQCPAQQQAGPLEGLASLCRTGDVIPQSNDDRYAKFVNEYVKLCETSNLPKVQTVFEETIPLPNLPMQKWTFITIAREGRRFDVYYNGKLVMSKRTQNVIDSKAAFGPIVAGDTNLQGKIALVEALPQKISQAEVEAKYKATSDTTGQPNVSAPTNILDYLPNCEGGGCITGPKMRPTSPLLDWQTQYG